VSKTSRSAPPIAEMRSALPINLTPVPNRQQMYHSFGRIKGVDDSIIANPQTVPIAAGEMVVWKSVEPEAHGINLGLDPRSNHRRQFE
jgi:hypothetical protein